MPTSTQSLPTHEEPDDPGPHVVTREALVRIHEESLAAGELPVWVQLGIPLNGYNPDAQEG